MLAPKRITERRTIGLYTQAAEITGRRLSASALERLVSYHNRYQKGMKGGRRVVLRACNLSGLDLSGINLSDADLPACDLSKANLRGTILMRANLFGARFDGADLSYANFERADLRGAKFVGATLFNTRLKAADMRRGEVLGEDGKLLLDPSCSFRGAALRKSDLEACKMSGVDFNDAHLEQVKFIGADLRNSSFDGASLRGVQMQGANLLDADMMRTAIDQETEGSANLMRSRRALRPPSGERLAEILHDHSRWVHSNKEEGARADFSGSDLTRMDMSGQFLAGADFNRAVLVGTDFRNSFLVGADMSETILIDALLEGADLRGADLRQALTQGTRLDCTTQGALQGAAEGEQISTRL